MKTRYTPNLTAYWCIHHNPDLTETGYPQKRTYLKTTWTGFPNQRSHEMEILRDWCRERFGKEVAFVQGVAATCNWIVEETQEDQFQQARPIDWGGYKTETRRVVMEIGNGGKITIVSDEVAEYSK